VKPFPPAPSFHGSFPSALAADGRGGLVKEGDGWLRGGGALTLTQDGFKEEDRDGRRDTEAEREE